MAMRGYLGQSGLFSRVYNVSSRDIMKLRIVLRAQATKLHGVEASVARCGERPRPQSRVAVCAFRVIC